MLDKILKSKFFLFIFINSLILAFQIFIIVFFFGQMVSEIPLWYTKNWGLGILALKENIIILPIVTALMVVFTSIIFKISESLYQYTFDKIVFNFTTILNLVITLSLMNIIRKVSFTNLFFLDYVGSELLNSFFVATIISAIITPFMIEFYKKQGLITDPKKHIHPGMILKQASARGGGLIFAISFTITSLFFIKLNNTSLSIIFGVILAALIGILDDISNTISSKKYKFLGNPIFRLLFLLPIPVVILLNNGVLIESINNPLGGVIDFTFFKFEFLGQLITPLGYIFTFIWVLWLINLLSWSNGVDGQYSGIVTIAGIVVSLLALRFTILSDIEINNSKMAIITAGAALGLLPYTWNPSKIMWGFGATSAGIA